MSFCFGLGPGGSRIWDDPGGVSFDGTDGIAWRVVECDGANVPGSRGRSCLIFFSEGVVRRLWDYPQSWRSLEHAKLEALMGAL